MKNSTNCHASGHEAAEQVKAFAPLASTSQMMLGTSVMYFDAAMPGGEIYEQAQFRISIAQRLLEGYASSEFKYEDDRFGQSLASVSALMISDAMALIDEMGRRVSCEPGPLTGNSGADVVVPIHGSRPEVSPRDA